MKLVFIDCETTGLDYNRHKVIDCSYMTLQMARPKKIYFSISPVDLENADPTALRINRYDEWIADTNHGPMMSEDFYAKVHETMGPRPFDVKTSPYAKFIETLQEATLVGANVQFDARFLFKELGYEPWHYKVLDIQVYAMGQGGRQDEIPSLSSIVKDINNTTAPIITVPDHNSINDVLAVRDIWRYFTGE